ncbi:Hypothetical Protein FCC1311_102282 [Hondaea fermentalgiana]|uniref:Uncharacterized protein n=1 Tax=Hondaea fermentalgiana TaxID=2315210 RepID=A0A2R5GTW0_9STRA|nr:Hypothetical Protein FCC1311_102282 [Hondaea fermentalgiana]|eukprot:GBG34005.1 Hypothetical Protein FCC1311_102282 [Hondaea fermentalgiana]
MKQRSGKRGWRQESERKGFAPVPSQGDDIVETISADDIRSKLSSVQGLEATREPQVLFKKTVYKVDVSLVYGLLLLVLALIDIFAVHSEWETEGVPANWHTALLYTHVVSFYMLATGFVVCNETHQEEYRKSAQISLLVNLTAFALRLHYELSFADFIPARYFPAAP